MEIPAKERYLYLTILPFIVIALIFLVVKYIPFKSACEPGEAKIVTKSNGEEKNSFKVGETIHLSVESKHSLTDFVWGLDESLLYINKSETLFQDSISVYFNEPIKTSIKVKINKTCPLQKEIEIY